jgi:hypothetical protein
LENNCLRPVKVSRGPVRRDVAIAEPSLENFLSTKFAKRFNKTSAKRFPKASAGFLKTLVRGCDSPEFVGVLL